MRGGYRIVDTDTHVGPALELLQERASKELAERWNELEPYLTREGRLWTDLGDWDRPYLKLTVAPYRYTRALGQAEASSDTDTKTKLAASAPRMKDGPEIGVWHDNAEGRLRAMDREGVDQHLVIPGGWALASTALDPALSMELLSAYNRYIVDYCAVDTARLKATLLVHGSLPEAAALEIKRLADEPCIAAVTVCLPQELPADHPSLHPIWQAMDEADLPLLHHSFFYEPPYFPGYRDMWDNAMVARASAHPWGAQRLLAFLMLSGLFDRYPRLRVGFAEVGAAWLPFWLERLRGQSGLFGTEAPDMKRDPLEYAREGHIYVGLEFYESEAAAQSIIDQLGEGVLMWQSDFCHSQCRFPNSPDEVLSWQQIGERAKRKLMSENADRYLRII